MSNTTAEASELVADVADKDQRKALRRRRVLGRSEDENKDLGNEGDDKRFNARTGAQQASESFVHLDRKKVDGIKRITESRVAIDATESNRRKGEDSLRRERLTKLQKEALQSAKYNAAIEMKWAELLEREIPQELHHEITNQMEGCNRVIKSKDDLILDFQKQLRVKDEEYVKALRGQAEEIEHLMKRIREEFSDMQSEYTKHLASIEDAYLEQRIRLITDQAAEMDALFEKRKNNESLYKSNKEKREDTCQKEIDDLLTQGAAKYNKLKIELEMNIQTLKQQLEEIKATYQLNTEKLDYNYRVLTELDVEKNAELARYKRRLTKLKDQLNVFSTKFHDMKTLDKKTNHELTEDYRRLTSKYKNLQSKFRHFEVSDTQKYEEVWAMHEEEAKDLVDQLLKADKILTEQQLGLEWHMPDDVGILQGKGASAGLPTSAPETTTKEEGNTNDEVTISGARVRAMLKLLAEEGGFMLSAGVKESIDSLPDDEAQLSVAENILKVLGVKSKEKMASLVNYFFTDTSQGTMVAKLRDPEAKIDNIGGENLVGQAPEDVQELRQIITAEDVINACKAYIEDSSEGTIGGAVAQSDAANKRRQQALKSYWDNLANVVSDVTMEVWGQLETDSLKLEDIINRRSQAITAVDAFQEKNAKLKKLLNSYLGDRKNDNMQIPPAQTMRVRQFAGGGNKIKGGAKTGGKSKTTNKSKPLMSATN